MPILYNLRSWGWPSRAACLALDRDQDTEFARDDAPDDAPAGAGGLEARIAAAVGPAIAHMGYELVRVLVLGRQRPTVQVMADRADGSLINVRDCEDITHAVGAVLDVDDPMPGAWTLEVSSAGIDRPLTRAKDWERFAGHQARVEMAVPLADGPHAGRRRFTGTVLGAGKLRLEGGEDVAFPLDHVRRAKLVLTDALIAATAPTPTPN